MLRLTCLLLVAALCQGQHNNHGNHHHENPLEHLVHTEVLRLIQADASISIAACSTKCDALFDLVAAADETMTDNKCAAYCKCEIQHTCTWHAQPSHPPHTHA